VLLQLAAPGGSCCSQHSAVLSAHEQLPVAESAAGAGAWGSVCHQFQVEWLSDRQFVHGVLLQVMH
jgi:hypothetical protein